jgi:hypothetical protein
LTAVVCKDVHIEGFSTDYDDVNGDYTLITNSITTYNGSGAFNPVYVRQVSEEKYYVIMTDKIATPPNFRAIWIFTTLTRYWPTLHDDVFALTSTVAQAVEDAFYTVNPFFEIATSETFKSVIASFIIPDSKSANIVLLQDLSNNSDLITPTLYANLTITCRKKYRRA